jgi:hypothetical protein
VARAFLLFCGHFCGVFWDLWCAADGFLMVKLWCDAGEMWGFDGAYLVTKNTPLFRIYFWANWSG